MMAALSAKPARPSLGDHISLFSGVGMTDRATEGAGFQTIATAEIDKWNRDLLTVRFPGAIHYDDVRKVRVDDWVMPGDTEMFARPLLMSGGFPCQDVSGAGTAKGLDGERSGLWVEFKRCINEFRPEYVLIENVAMLRSRGLDRVLNDLHHMGYDAQWDCIPAAFVGAPHLRDRVYIGAVRRRDRVAGTPGKATGTKMIGHVGRPGDGLVKVGSGAITKLPRAGAVVGGLLFQRNPMATIKAAKKALAEHQHRCSATPTAASNPQNGEKPDTWLARREVLKAKGTNGNGAGMPLSIAVQLVPTPTKQDGSNNGGPAQFERNSLPLNAFAKLYPTPSKQDGVGGPGTSPRRAGGMNLRTQINVLDGDYKLSPRWVEWLMGLPLDWTNPDVPNCSLGDHDGWRVEPLPRVDKDAPHRRARLMALGNGLVPQCASIALNDLLAW